jgi:hypothetical protein
VANRWPIQKRAKAQATQSLRGLAATFQAEIEEPDQDQANQPLTSFGLKGAASLCPLGQALSAGAALKGFDETLEGLFKPARCDHRTGRIRKTLDHHKTVDLAVQVRVEELGIVSE